MLAELFPYAHQVFVVFTIIYFLTILGIIAVVVSENRNPVKSLAWVTVLLLVPILGMFLYVFFGRRTGASCAILPTTRLWILTNWT